MDFNAKVRDAQKRRESVLCVGLDPDPERLPPHLLRGESRANAVIAFNRAVIDETRRSAMAYKLNLAFYEALGADGWPVLEATLDAVPDDIITIADGKRGDIGNSARFYADAVFEQLRFDACTVSGYMGRDSIEPFLQFGGRAAFLLVRTSNSGARDFQEIDCPDHPLYMRVAQTARRWVEGSRGTLGFVVGATDIGALRDVRQACPEIPLLIPGIGAQGGDAGAVMQITLEGEAPVIVNSSRSIIYASSERDFAEAAGRAAEEFRSRLQSAQG